MPEPISFQEAIEATDGSDRALLLGNGFSIQYFSYKTLLERADLEGEDKLGVYLMLSIRMTSRSS